MFGFFEKLAALTKLNKPTVPAEQNPVPLPEIPAEKKNPVALHDMLKNNTAIWGWYKVMDIRNNELNYSAMLNMSIGFEGYAVFRKEGDYIVKYQVDIVGENHAIYMRLSEVCRLTPSNVMELFNTEIKDAYKLFYDNESEYSAGCRCWVHTVNEAVIEDKLSNKRVFYVGEEYFPKKSDYPDGYPPPEKE